MPEVERILFSHEELVALMLKEQGITDGLWRLLVRFNLGAANLTSQMDESLLVPGSIVSIRDIGIVRTDEPVPGITVDASSGEAVRELLPSTEGAAS